MVRPPKAVHPTDGQLLLKKTPIFKAIEVEIYAGKLHIEWDYNAVVTPIGQLPFFIKFLKMGG